VLGKDTMGALFRWLWDALLGWGFHVRVPELCVKRGNIPLVENPYVISAWAACFSPLFICYYSSILDIIYN
jgi:hypothetical protein